MKPESLVKLAGSGNVSTVEEEWGQLIELDDSTADVLTSYTEVLKELTERGQAGVAETLAWSAVESAMARESEEAALRVASKFLLTLKKSEELRKQVAGLYRKVYASHEALEPLIAEAGLEGGRPVRRAIRTLDTCLALEEGSYLAERDEDGAGRVESIDKDTWEFDISTGRRSETLECVLLADQYRPADEDDLQVMRVFHPDKLNQHLDKDPTSVVISLCRKCGGKIDTDYLESVLTPSPIAYGDWKKWWTKARTALRKLSSITIEGRNPSHIIFHESPAKKEDVLKAKFKTTHDPISRLGVVEDYISDCNRFGEEPCVESLKECFQYFVDAAMRHAERLPMEALTLALIARKLGEQIGCDNAAEGAVLLLKTATDLTELFGEIESDALIVLGCVTLVEARPDDWQGLLQELLPTLPLSACERSVGLMSKAGCGPDDLDPVVQTILSDAVAHNEALLWLWDGSKFSDSFTAPVRGTVIGKILHALEECGRNDQITKDVARKISARSRAVVGARRYARFTDYLDSLDSGRAWALNRLVSRLDNLGRSVPEDIFRMISSKFPITVDEAPLELWEQEDVLYVTRESMLERQATIEHHVNVKMKANSKAIGEAAEKGDLSENSEYKFALEERDLLRAKLALMNSQMEIAKVLDPAEVPADVLGIGSRAVFARTDDGEQLIFIAAGPWDGDLTLGKFNYRAPLAQKVLGMHVGEKIDFDHTGAVGEYELTELHNSLLEDAPMPTADAS